jgi:hypothetical protein
MLRHVFACRHVRQIVGEIRAAEYAACGGLESPQRPFENRHVVGLTARFEDSSNHRNRKHAADAVSRREASATQRVPSRIVAAPLSISLRPLLRSIRPQKRAHRNLTIRADCQDFGTWGPNTLSTFVMKISKNGPPSPCCYSPEFETAQGSRSEGEPRRMKRWTNGLHGGPSGGPPALRALPSRRVQVHNNINL